MAGEWDGVMRYLRKEAPVSGDVHISSTGQRKRKKKSIGNVAIAFDSQVVKVDQSLGLVMGWAIVCKQDGEPYFDLQNDHVPEDAMLEAAADFMANARTAKAMHKGDAIGSIVFAFPMTEDVAKAFGIETATTGLMIAMRPGADVLAKFASGEFSGFSIGGRRIEDEVIR